MKNVLEIAELLYKSSREGSTDQQKKKMSPSVRELAPHTQKMYRRYAEAVLAEFKDRLTVAELCDSYAEGTLCTAASDTISSILVDKYFEGELSVKTRVVLRELMLAQGVDVVPDVTRDEVLAQLAEELAYKVNDPMGGFSEGIRDAFEQFAEIVGVTNLSPEVRKAMDV